MALDIDPNYVEAHNCLANALKDMKDLVGALTHYQKALAINPNDGVTHFNLGLALREQGKFAAALASLKKAQQLGSNKVLLSLPSAQAIKQVERSLELEQQLPAILKGMEPPRDLASQLELAECCYFTQHHVSAARYYIAEAQRTLMLPGEHYDQAVCAAVLAAAGTSKDAGKLEKDEPARLRQQALHWLNSALAGGKNLLAADPAKANSVRYHLRLWQCYPELASVRDAKELAKLPAAERQQWQALWAEVAALVNSGKK
jgi:tetratricopeptide (TPR) repeat protein